MSVRNCRVSTHRPSIPCWFGRAAVSSSKKKNEDDLQQCAGVRCIGSRVLQASCFYIWQKRSRLGERQTGVPDFGCALREYFRVHDENVGMKIAAQRFEKCFSNKMSFLFRSVRYVARVDSLLGVIVILRFCLFRSVRVWWRQGQKDSVCWCTCW